jgi:pimeloyl-ACP methyl ester carboxylesterase
MSTRVSSLVKLKIGGVDQWLLVRGRDRSRPVLLLVQAGPGFPIIQEAGVLQRRLRLEDDFVVAYWDQRGCGKSFSSHVPPASLNLDQLVADTYDVVRALEQHLGVQGVSLLGFSLGGTIAALTAARYPRHVHVLITVGMDVDFADAERVAYDFAIRRAEQTGNSRALRELNRIGAPPHLDAQRFGVRLKWVANFGGVNRRETYASLLAKNVWRLLSAPEYTPLDVVGALRGMRFVQQHSLPQLAGLDLRKQLPGLAVPIYMLEGRHDYAAPPALAEEYARRLHAPAGKHLIWFDRSAHMPHFEEPERFREVVLDSARQAIPQPESSA